MKMSAKARNAIGPSEAVAKEFVDKAPKNKKRSMFMKMMKDRKKEKK